MSVITQPDGAFSRSVMFLLRQNIIDTRQTRRALCLPGSASFHQTLLPLSRLCLVLHGKTLKIKLLVKFGQFLLNGRC
jgi:hypothetical protein